MPVTTTLLSLVSQSGDVAEERVRPDYSEGHIDVEKSTSLLHDHPGIKSWPHFDVVGSKSVGFGWVERLGTNSFKPETSHHGVEEDFEEVQVISIGGFHDLDPLDGYFVLGAVVLSLVGWYLGALAKTVDAGTPVDEELKFLLDLVPDDSKHFLAENFGVIRNLWLELDRVLVDALDFLLVEDDLEVVGEELELSACSLWVSGWLLWE